MAKKKKLDELMYKGRPIVRRNNVIYYGFLDDKFLVQMVVQDTEKIMDTEIASKVSVQLQTNNTKLQGKERMIKKSEREGLFAALDLGAVWLEDALSYEG